MNHPKFRFRRSRHRRGAMIVLCCVAIVVLLVFAVLVVDLSWASLARAELQANADSACRAALQSYMEDTSKNAQPIRVRNAQAVGQRFFESTPVVNQKMRVPAGKFEFGTYQNNRFSSNTRTPNAVRLTLDRARPQGFSFLMAPFIGVESFQLKVKSVTASRTMDVVLAIDASRSMARIVGSGSILPPGVKSELEPPGEGSRWLAVVDSVTKFLQYVNQKTPSVRVSLVVFGGGNFNRVPTPWDNSFARIETDLELVGPATRSVLEKMDVYSQNTLPHATSVYMGLHESLQEFYKHSNPDLTDQSIILLSDGQQSKHDPRNPMLMAQEAKRAGVKIHTVYFSGNASGRAGMQAFAKITNGQAIVADTERELDEAFGSIATFFKTSLVE